MAALFHLLDSSPNLWVKGKCSFHEPSLDHLDLGSTRNVLSQHSELGYS